MADQDRTFSTDTVEANLAAQQGLGVGQRELDAERDPGEGPPVNAEPDDEDEGLADDRRTLKAAPGQGAKTRKHQKDAVSRRV